MTPAVSLLDAGATRAILDELLDARLAPLLAAIERGTGPRDAPGLLTREQLATLLQVDLRTLRRLEREGALPRAARIGGRIHRWRRADVDRWLESGAPALQGRKRSGSVCANRRSP